MAEVVLATDNERSIWESKYLQEYVRGSRFDKFMGTADTSIIVVKHELEKEAGKTINIPLITRLSNKGVGGSTSLRGRETQIGNYNCPISINWNRNGVVVPKSESYKTEIDLLNAGKPLLKQWSAEALRTDLIYQLMSIIPTATGNTTTLYAEITEDLTNGGYEIASGYTPSSVFDRYEGVSYTTASEAEKDIWLVANSDRVLFGATRGNYSGDHSVDLLKVGASTDNLTVATAQLAKRMASQANPHITPHMTEDGREFYVMFCGPRSFRDLKGDSTMLSANRDARPRDVEKNPIFQDGDLFYDGILFREVPEIPHITNVGDSSTQEVEPNFLCGQQAVGIAWGQTPSPKTETNDYGFRPGVAIEELRGVQKLAFNGKQRGVVTVYTSASGD
jgi:N4-gp56 family major capsid protein